MTAISDREPRPLGPRLPFYTGLVFSNKLILHSNIQFKPRYKISLTNICKMYPDMRYPGYNYGFIKFVRCNQGKLNRAFSRRRPIPCNCLINIDYIFIFTQMTLMSYENDSIVKLEYWTMKIYIKRGKKETIARNDKFNSHLPRTRRILRPKV